MDSEISEWVDDQELYLNCVDKFLQLDGSVDGYE